MKNTVLIKTYRDNQDHLPKCQTDKTIYQNAELESLSQIYA